MVVLFVGCGCAGETRKNIKFLRRKTYGTAPLVAPELLALHHIGAAVRVDRNHARNELVVLVRTMI